MNSQELNNFYEAYLDVYTDLDEERAEGVKPYQPRKRRPLDPEKALSGEKGDGSGYGADEKFKKPDDKITKPGTEVPAPKKGGYGRIFSNIPYGIGAHANRNRSRNSTVRGMDPGAPRSEKIAPQEKKKASKEIVRKEGYDLYDVILSHLLDEGYAETPEQAEVIMVNMSEDWRESICEGAYDVYLNRMGVKSKLSDMAKEIYKDPKEKREDDRKREKRNKTHSVGRDLLNKYIDTMNKDN
jgi:hypothetical protein